MRVRVFHTGTVVVLAAYLLAGVVNSGMVFPGNVVSLRQGISVLTRGNSSPAAPARITCFQQKHVTEPTNQGTSFHTMLFGSHIRLLAAPEPYLPFVPVRVTLVHHPGQLPARAPPRA
jgi:hypothetical protein